MTSTNQSNADVPERETLELISESHEDLGERLIERIKSRPSPKGQFGIKFLMIAAVAAALFFSIPNFFGVSNVAGYWSGIALLTAILAPMLGFLSAAGAMLLGFNLAQRRAIGWVVGIIAGVPLLIYLCSTDERSGAIQIFSMAWALQLGAIYVSNLIFR